MNLILFGFKKCGKTYLGRKLAETLNLPFIDTDHRIEDLYATMTGEFLTFREIYQKVGEDLFRQLERYVIANLKEVDHSVIAVGGGALLDQKNQAILEKLGKLVYLKIEKEALKQRLLSGNLPLYLDPTNKEYAFEKMYAERKILYERIPSVWIDTSDKSEQEILDLLKHLIEKKHG